MSFSATGHQPSNVRTLFGTEGPSLRSGFLGGPALQSAPQARDVLAAEGVARRPTDAGAWTA
jgi:hypothetical protein